MKKLLVLMTAMAFMAVGAGCSSTEPSRESDPQDATRGLGYLSGYEKSPDRTGVTVHEDTAYEGLNLWVSGHRPAAYLMDMNGNILHTWEKSWEEAFPSINLPEEALDILPTDYWRKVHLTPRGHLLAIFDQSGLIKLDRESRLLWSKFDHQHHDLDVGESGKIYTIAKAYEDVELYGQTRKRLTGVLRVYDQAGNLQEEHDLLKAFRRSPYRAVLGNMERGQDELFHTNSIRVLDDGRILLSFLRLDAVAWFNPKTGRIERVLQNLFSAQHDAQILDNGNLLLFDNSNFMRSSRAVEIDLSTEKVVWSYGQRERERFFSRCCGTVQRLPNGNTLITDSDSGEAFEVTSEGEVVWKFINPHTTKQQKIGTLFEMERLSADDLEWVRHS